MDNNAAHSLEGITLRSGWKVTKKQKEMSIKQGLIFQ